MDNFNYERYMQIMRENEGQQTKLWEFVDSLTPPQRYNLYNSKWMDAIPDEEIERIFALWTKVSVRKIEFPEDCTRSQISLDPRNLSPILAVDATPTKGGGVFYDPISQICNVYSVDFEKDLGIPCIHDGQIFEMFNLLFALFIFKQKLINTKFIRIINDHFKIRSAKKSVLVPVIYKIIDWLEEERGLKVVNNPKKNWDLVVKGNERQFLKLADCLSKDKVFQTQQYPDFERLGILIGNVSETLVKKFYGYF